MARYRKVERKDASAIVLAVHDIIERVQERGSKVWTKFIEADEVLDYISETDYAYIVEDTFLVIYEIGSPWYTTARFLNEKLVLALKPGGNFTDVTDFLEERRRAEDAVLTVVGTALAISDRALVRLYSREGFTGEVITLVKEP